MALAAYVVSAFVAVFQNRSVNSVRSLYTRHIVESAAKSGLYLTVRNREKAAAWVSGEAEFTIRSAVTLIVSIIGLTVNITMMTLVFYLTLGGAFALAFCSSLVIAGVTTKLFRSRISFAAVNEQTSKQRLNDYIPIAWDRRSYENIGTSDDKFAEYQQLSNKYYKCMEKSVVLTQFASTIPVLLSVPLIVGSVYIMFRADGAAYGALVALLPRVFQVLGSVHTLASNSARAAHVRDRYVRLFDTDSFLEKHGLMEKVSIDKITIIQSGENAALTTGDLLNRMTREPAKVGRYTVRGPNGSGKSSLLKFIKHRVGTATYVSSESLRVAAGSSGEQALQAIQSSLHGNSTVVLLDEWNANLDSNSEKIIESCILAAARDKAIVEVLHR